jgi:hypothetical protein
MGRFGSLTAARGASSSGRCTFNCGSSQQRRYGRRGKIERGRVFRFVEQMIDNLRVEENVSLDGFSSAFSIV